MSAVVPLKGWNRTQLPEVGEELKPRHDVTDSNSAVEVGEGQSEMVHDSALAPHHDSVLVPHQGRRIETRGHARQRGRA